MPAHTAAACRRADILQSENRFVSDKSGNQLTTRVGGFIIDDHYFPGICLSRKIGLDLIQNTPLQVFLFVIARDDDGKHRFSGISHS